MSSNIILGGSVVMSNTNTPTRAGQRVTTESEIASISNPSIGEIIYIEDTGTFVYIKSLKSKKVGKLEIKNALVDQYEKLVKGDDLDLNWNEVL